MYVLLGYLAPNYWYISFTLSIIWEYIEVYLSNIGVEIISNLRNDVIINTIVYEIKYQKAVEIRQFGRFSQKKIKEKMNAWNPRTGEKIRAKARLSVAFKMSKELKNRINNRLSLNWKKIFLLR